MIISNNKDVASAGIDFATFSLHMLLAIVPVLIVGYLQLRFIFRSIKSLKFSEPYELIGNFSAIAKTPLTFFYNMKQNYAVRLMYGHEQQILYRHTQRTKVKLGSFSFQKSFTSRIN